MDLHARARVWRANVFTYMYITHLFFWFPNVTLLARPTSSRITAHLHTARANFACKSACAGTNKAIVHQKLVQLISRAQPVAANALNPRAPASPVAAQDRTRAGVGRSDGNCNPQFSQCSTKALSISPLLLAVKPCNPTDIVSFAPRI